ncbi:hypothetical protein GIB67_009513, partial [Kingdonia uniflora]
MEFCNHLAYRGVPVTFVTTEFLHNKVRPKVNHGESKNRVRIVSLPDGLEAGTDRSDTSKLTESIWRNMPGHFSKLIGDINNSCDNKISCVVADETIGWALEIAEKMGIKRAAFWPVSMGVLALTLHIPKLIADGVMDENGNPRKNEMIQLSPDMPPMNMSDFVWNHPGNPKLRESVFKFMLAITQAAKISNWHICNSYHELEPAASNMIPNLLTVGPLLASTRLSEQTGHFWPEDSTCITWLDKQPTRLVTYVAFGSTGIFNQCQLDELTDGLELSGRPFLLVLRSNLSGDIALQDGFKERVAQFGKIVEWAPQQEVLAHPSIACFITHCGWNSTIEALSMGVPLVCWPYFADQIHDKNYICDVWKVGFSLDRDENGIISKDEIKRKIEDVVSDNGVRLRVLEIKETAKKNVGAGGTSTKNLENFIQAIK